MKIDTVKLKSWRDLGRPIEWAAKKCGHSISEIQHALNNEGEFWECTPTLASRRVFLTEDMLALHAKGWSLKRAAVALGVSRAAVKYRMSRIGRKWGPQGLTAVPMEDIARIARLGVSLKVGADKLGLTRQCISIRLASAGLGWGKPLTQKVPDAEIRKLFRRMWPLEAAAMGLGLTMAGLEYRARVLGITFRHRPRRRPWTNAEIPAATVQAEFDAGCNKTQAAIGLGITERRLRAYLRKHPEITYMPKKRIGLQNVSNEELNALFAQGLNQSEVAQKLGVHTSTLHERVGRSNLNAPTRYSTWPHNTDPERFADMWNDPNVPFDAITEWSGLSRRTLYCVAKRRGLPLRRESKLLKNRVNKSQLITLMNSGFTRHEIAVFFKCSDSGISQFMKAVKLPIGGRGKSFLPESKYRGEVGEETLLAMRMTLDAERYKKEVERP